MGKVFRFHQGNNNIEDWQISEAYGHNAIQGIQDPAGATAKQEITSIPSPFARIELMRTAFKKVCESQTLEGSSIFHKMVSDCLDVGELFFNMDTFPDQLEIIPWDKKEHLDELLNSKNAKHRRLGETLKLYFDQDKQAHHFDLLQRLYLLNYRKGPKKLNIIGSTSPSTLFFTSANDLDFVQIRFGKKKVFSDEYTPLYTRDVDFQKFIYGLQWFLPEFNQHFKELDDYLNLNFTHLNAHQKAAIQEMSEAEFRSKFAALNVSNEGNPVEILGYPLRKKVNDPRKIEQSSDFVIDSEKYQGLKPLVLPNEKYTEKLTYTTDNWDSSYKAPFYDPTPLEQRTLPWVGSQYPYLTIDDVLEPYLIRTVFPIQKSKYFTGNLRTRAGEQKGFLLPLKKGYFDFFDVDSLQGFTAEGKPVIEMEPASNEGIKVTLRIPIQKGKHITFQRIYYPSLQENHVEQPDLPKNQGVLIENQFTLSIFPFLQLEAPHANYYRIALMDRDILPLTQGHRYHLKFYASSQDERHIQAVKSRSQKEEGDALSSHFYVLNEAFDYIELHDGAGHKGLIIPIFNRLPKGTDKFTFAIDFGTTNTHIEYRKGADEPTPFEINEEDLQMATLHEPDIEQKDISLSGTGATALLLTLPHEFLPLKIGKKHKHYFPQRSVIHYNESQDFKQTTYALADMNVSFTFERESIPKNILFDTNLKWSNFKPNSNELKKIDAYFENLMLLIRNKVLLNGGDLSKTELIWFYPSSMLPFKVGMMEMKWENLFHRYVTKKRSPMKLSESIAPFYYYKSRLGVTATEKPVVSIDIGGGTSDIVIYKKNDPEILTSIRFAANAIFGDAYNSNPSLNGFINKYLEQFKDLGIASYYLPKFKRSEDITGFLFSLEHNQELRKRNIEASFAKELKQDADFRIIFLLFYSAIIYHLASIMRAKGMDSPAYLTFSGTGSKIINFADPRPKLKSLSILTQHIFEKVMGKTLDPIELKQYENPKEITCKGGLMIDKEIDIDDIKTTLIGNREKDFIEEKPITYPEISDALLYSVIGEYKDFIRLFFQLNEEMNFSKVFGTQPASAEAYQEILTGKAKEFLLLGIEQKNEEFNEEKASVLNESLFFYPLIGSLNRLAYSISENIVEA